MLPLPRTRASPFPTTSRSPSTPCRNAGNRSRTISRPTPNRHPADHRQWPHRSAGRLGRVSFRGPRWPANRGGSRCAQARFAAGFRAQADRRPGQAIGLQRRFSRSRGRLKHAPCGFLLAVTLPADGIYDLHLGDAEHKGGAEYGYRLRISAPWPDFALRVVPSNINVQAGGTVPITVYALRKDGFSGEIALALKDAPQGFALSGARVPANQNQMRFTLTSPQLSGKGRSISAWRVVPQSRAEKSRGPPCLRKT